jgi:hypothetical protein
LCSRRQNELRTVLYCTVLYSRRKCRIMYSSEKRMQNKTKDRIMNLQVEAIIIYLDRLFFFSYFFFFLLVLYHHFSHFLPCHQASQPPRTHAHTQRITRMHKTRDIPKKNLFDVKECENKGELDAIVVLSSSSSNILVYCIYNKYRNHTSATLWGE